jgi:hypothetical protein
MIFDLRAGFHMADQPKDQPISACRGGVDKAEPEEIAVA